jgi:hypothetical protein
MGDKRIIPLDLICGPAEGRQGAPYPPQDWHRHPIRQRRSRLSIARHGPYKALASRNLAHSAYLDSHDHQSLGSLHPEICHRNSYALNRHSGKGQEKVTVEHVLAVVGVVGFALPHSRRECQLYWLRVARTIVYSILLRRFGPKHVCGISQQRNVCAPAFGNACHHVFQPVGIEWPRFYNP